MNFITWCTLTWCSPLQDTINTAQAQLASLYYFDHPTMAESQQSLEQQCVAAFKQGNHDQAVQLLPQLQQPGDVTTEFKLSTKNIPLNRGARLLHLAAYHGWLDIIKIVQKCNHIECDCRDSIGLTPLHYAASSGKSLVVIDYLIKKRLWSQC